MILKQCIRIRSFVSAGLVLLICVSSVSFVAAQQKPTEFDSRLDDKQLCASGNGLAVTEYCDFWNRYNTNRTNPDEASQAKAKDARNELIKYVRGRVDRFYEKSTNKKKFNRNLLQTILDILEVGAATAIGISNGERAKEVIGISLGGLQAARTSLNKNFDLLQTRILINKMRENRAQILTRVVDNMKKPISDYSWLDAKNDLREYLYAGTFNNALDSLAAETGEAAQNAEKGLRKVSNEIVTVSESTETDETEAIAAKLILDNLGQKLGVSQTEPDATITLKSILAELKKDSELKRRVEAKNLSDSSTGADIKAGIIEIRREVILDRREELARKINKAIISVNKAQ